MLLIRRLIFATPSNCPNRQWSGRTTVNNRTCGIPTTVACVILVLAVIMNEAVANPSRVDDDLEQRVAGLLGQMTLAEKIGQMAQVNAGESSIPEYLADDIRSGRVGSVLNAVDLDIINELQRIAVEESRLGIPLLVGRDVIHGFKTVMPIPLGQAASWNPDLSLIHI